MDQSFWRGRAVFGNGHAGFRRRCISLCFSQPDAKLESHSYTPPKTPKLLAMQPQNRLRSLTIGDIRSPTKLTSAVQKAKPLIFIRMVAQLSMRESCVKTVETFPANIIGTINLSETMRSVDTVKVIWIIITDTRCENQKLVWPYRVNDCLGGHDSASSSEAYAELVTAIYRKSFPSVPGVQLVSMRSGNVIGGGSWVTDRLSLISCVRLANSNLCGSGRSRLSGIFSIC